MKAVLCTRHGPPDALELVDLPEPEAGPGEVVVEVRAVGLNFFDTLIIQNKYQVKPALPFSPGAELAGIVASVGPGVSHLAPGTRVMGYLRRGAARQKVAVAAELLAPIPDEIDDDIAAGLIITYATTLHAFKDRGALQPGETVAVLGAAGGVGIAALEIAKLMGARVIACALSAEKLDFCRKYGADETLNYETEDLKTRLKALCDGAGADVVYDPVGGHYAEAALRATAWGGRYLVIGFAAGEIPKIPLNLLLLKGNALIGVNWAGFAEREPAATRQDNEQIMQWVRDGQLTPHVDRVYSLEETPQALQAIARREVKGKIIIRP